MSILNNQIELNKDFILMSLTALLNVEITQTFNLLKSIDNRVNKGLLCLSSGVSRQVYSAYVMYLKYLPEIDEKQFLLYDRTK